MALLVPGPSGIYCPKAKVYIDPVQPVDKALITHGHADHARPGHKSYLCTRQAAPVIQYRLPKARIQTVEFGEAIFINGVRVSFHPAGHLPGSAQIRLEAEGEIWVVTGDFKVQQDGLAEDFEVVPCTHFIPECTFGLPVYKWPTVEKQKTELNQWWRDCKRQGKRPILGVYSLGKAQRIMTMLDRRIGPIVTHGAIAGTNEVLRAQGMRIPPDIRFSKSLDSSVVERSIVLCPPAALRSKWSRQLSPSTDAMASGWMAIRGNRRRRNVDRGFVISDHADWVGLIETVNKTGAAYVYPVHGYTHTFSKYLRKKLQLDARPFFEAEN